MQFIYIFLNMVSLVVISLLGAFSYHNREEKCSKYFMYAMIFMVIWTLGTIFELFVHDLGSKVFFRNIIQFGMAFVSVVDYWFVVCYTEAENKIHKSIMQLFVVLNSIAMILLFTDPMHHLMRSSVYLIESEGSFDLIVTSTGLGIFFVLIRFFLFAFATLLLFIHLAKIFKSMQRQVIMISTGFLLALVLLIAKQYWFENQGFSIPMSAIMCLPYFFISVGIFKYDFLSVSPLAKDWVINSLEEGIFVLSKEGKILESNTAATRFLSEFGTLIDREDLNEIYTSGKDLVHQLRFDTGVETRYFELKIHHLVMTNGKMGGGVAVLRDTTSQMIRQFELKEKAELDGLTQIYNRRTLERKYESIKEGTVCMMIIDIDKFKKINDTFGHPTGDAVIIGVVRAMKKCIRSKDLIGRLGGDEFCIILADCFENACEVIANRVLEELGYQQYENGIKLPAIGVSIGAYSNIDVNQMSFKEAYKVADAMLYQAKQNGGNCVALKQ